MPQSQHTLVDFGERAASFQPLDDRVMGGVSRSSLLRSDDGNAVFAGEVSLENNGGFASVRASDLALDLSEYTVLVLRARGDGNRYKLRLHDSEHFDRVAFEAVFETVDGQWIDVEIPLDDFRPMWRGRLVPGAPELVRAGVTMVGLMISDGQQGSFALEVDWLAAR